MDQDRRRRNKGKQTARGDRRTVHQGSRRSSSAADAVRFLREHEIRDQLESRTHNREYPTERFISLRCLEEIWTFDCLESFLDILDIDSDRESVLYVRKNLIKVLSILVAIRWDDWSRFADLFLDDGRRRLREDSSLPFCLTALEDNTFLGKSFASDFLNVQYAYLPIIVEQGESKTYPPTRPLPFLKTFSTRIGAGAYGVVTKEVVACHQFKPKSEYATDLIGVCNSPIHLVETSTHTPTGRNYCREKAVSSTRRLSERGPKSDETQLKSFQPSKNSKISGRYHSRRRRRYRIT